MASYEHYNTRNDSYPPQQYADHNEGAYNPYTDSQPHRTYEQAGYGYQDTEYRDNTPPTLPAKEKESSPYATSRPVQPRSPRAMKRWRHEHQGNLWTAGSRVRCCGRFFCCTLLIFLFLLISIVLSLLLWIKPPNVVIGDVALVTNGSAVQPQSNGVAVNLEVPISVDNPNYFSVTFDSINAKILYPINSTQIGGGNLNKLEIQSNKQTNFTLPFMLNYTTTIDPQYRILDDIADRCGFSGQAAQQLTVNYEIKLDFKILFIPIKPTIKNSASFPCPFTASEIPDLLKAAGINLPNLSALLKSFI